MRYCLIILAASLTPGVLQAQSLYSSSPNQLCVDERNSLSKTANQSIEADSSCKASLIDAINCCNGADSATDSECSIKIVPTTSSLSTTGGINAPGTSQSNLIQLQINGVAQNEALCKSKLASACTSANDPASVELKQTVMSVFDGLESCLDQNIAKSRLLQSQGANTVTATGNTTTISSDGVTNGGIHDALQSAAASANTSLVGTQEASLMTTVRKAISAAAISSSFLAGSPTIPVPLKP